MSVRSFPHPVAIIISAVLAGACGNQTEPTPDYLCQTTPQDTPLRFAPGIVSTVHHEHSRIVFSPDGLELYWAVIPVDPASRSGKGQPLLSGQQNIWSTRRTSAGWSRPQVLPLTKDGSASSPSLDSDGSTFYFKVLDPRADPDERPRPTIQYAATREDGEWKNPAVVSHVLPRIKGMVSTSFCFADNGNIYFDSGGPDETGSWQWTIYVSEYRDEKFDEPRLLTGGVNDGEVNWCPWISPDESYLIWSSHREGGTGNGDLYVSFQQPDASWGEPVNLGKRINTTGQERFPGVSPDGLYLFFARHTDNETYNDIFWVDAGIIQTLNNRTR